MGAGVFEDLFRSAYTPARKMSWLRMIDADVLFLAFVYMAPSQPGSMLLLGSAMAVIFSQIYLERLQCRIETDFMMDCAVSMFP